MYQLQNLWEKVARLQQKPFCARARITPAFSEYQHGIQQVSFSIVKHIKNLAISTDADLKDLLLSIKQSLPRLSEMKSWDDVVDYTVGSLAVTVGEALLNKLQFSYHRCM